MPYKDPEKAKEYAKKNKDRFNAWRKDWQKETNYNKRYNLKKFGLTLEQYNEMFKNQNGLCAICHKPEVKIDLKTGLILSLAVDHNHITGKVRGLLCRNCNVGIGYLLDSSDILRNAALYLDKHNE